MRFKCMQNAARKHVFSPVLLRVFSTVGYSICFPNLISIHAIFNSTATFRGRALVSFIVKDI